MKKGQFSLSFCYEFIYNFNSNASGKNSNNITLLKIVKITLLIQYLHRYFYESIHRYVLI